MRKFYLSLMLLFVSVFAVSTSSYAQTNIALNKTYTLSPNTGNGNADSGLTKLTNGVSIVLSKSDTSQYVSWSQDLPTIIVDLGSIVSIDSAELFVVFESGGQDRYPNFVEFYYSLDGVSYTNLGTVNIHSFVSGLSYKYYCSFASVDARYFKIYVDKNPTVWESVILSEVMIYSAAVTVPTPIPTSTLPPASPTLSPPTPTPTPTLSTGSTTASFGGVVYGRIVDKFKSPLPEIKVEYSTLGDEYLGKNPVLTDNDGYYYFEDVDTQFGYGLVMTAKRYGTITLSYDGTVKDSVVRVPDKMLVRGNSQLFTLSGSVKDLYSSPVEHARVRIKSSGDPRIVYTDSLGAFSVSDLFIGTYTVTVKHSGYYPGRAKYSNSDGLDGSVDISLQEK